jgi:serine acetyltransferase
VPVLFGLGSTEVMLKAVGGVLSQRYGVWLAVLVLSRLSCAQVVKVRLPAGEQITVPFVYSVPVLELATVGSQAYLAEVIVLGLVAVTPKFIETHVALQVAEGPGVKVKLMGDPPVGVQV